MKSTGRSSVKALSNNLIYFIVLSAFVGLFASSYLLINMMTGVGQSCTPFQACYFPTEKYSTIFSSNLIIFPALYFFLVLIFTLYFFNTESKQIGKFLYYLSHTALLLIAFFLYLEVYRNSNLCITCIVIILASLSVFASGLYLPKYLK